MIQLTKNGARWTCLPEFAPKLDRLLADAGRITRQTHAKLITKHELEGTVYFIKHYVNSDVAGRPLKYFFKPSPARREWARAILITQRGVPLVKHLAFGERWALNGLQESILITEGFDGVPLVESPHRQSAEVQTALGRFLRLNHDRGVLQRDLQHNILVRTDPLEILRVDVYHAEVKASLSETERRQNIAYLNVYVPLRDEFYASYGWTSQQAQVTRERSEVIRRARHYSRSKRCFKRNTDFSPQKMGGLKWFTRTKSLDARVKQIIQDPERWLRETASLFKGFDRASTVGAADGLVLKRYNFRKLQNLFKDLFRSSQALRAYRKAHHLELLHIATPRPIVAAERRCCRFLITGYLVVEEVPNARDLGEYLASVTRPDRNLIARLGDLIGRLHHEGFSNRDMKETNILVTADLRPILVDLDGLKFINQVFESRAAADLARLVRATAKFSCVTHMSRVLFLRHYCRARKLTHVPRL